MLINHLERAEKLLLQIAEEQFSETEYAGKTLIRCAHCGQEQTFLKSPDADLLCSAHDEDCPTREARQILGETFVNAYNAEMAAEVAERKKQESRELKARKDEECRKAKQLENTRLQKEMSAKKRAENKLNKHLSAMAGNFAMIESSCKKR